LDLYGLLFKEKEKPSLIAKLRSKVVEQKGSPEKDKFGHTGVLVWLTRQNIYRIQEALLDRVQRAENKEESGIKEAQSLSDQFLELYNKIAPS
jgi:hypothetical protein